MRILRFGTGCLTVLTTMVCLCAVLSAQTFQARRGTTKTFWQGQSGIYTIQWTSEDITARTSFSSKPVFSIRAFAEQDVREMIEALAEDSTDMGACSRIFRYALLAVVGSYLCVEEQNFAFCDKETHPTVWSRFATFNLERGGQEMALSDLFADATLLKALLQDTFVRQALATLPIKPEFKTVHELTRFFQQQSVNLLDKQGCPYLLDSLALTSFALYGLQGDSLAVRLELSSWGVCRTQTLQLCLVLPISALLPTLQTPFVEALQQAHAGAVGFTMAQRSQALKQGVTGFDVILSSAAYFKNRTQKKPTLPVKPSAKQ
jgi:hypothetical protein